MSFRIKENSLVVQWLGLCASTAGRTGSILAWELRSHMLRSQKKKESKRIVTTWMLLMASLLQVLKAHLFYFTFHIFDIWKLIYKIYMNAQYGWEIRFSPLELMIRKKLFLAELSINIYNNFKFFQTRQYAHCIPLVKRNGMQIIGLSSVPRENYRRNKQKKLH